MLSLTLRQLEYATAVGHHGGMTTAAKALHVSQPALSVAIAQLETLLGRPLFLRRAGGRLTPTSFGRLWLDRAEQQLLGLARLTDLSNTTEDLHLAIFEDLAAGCLAPLLSLAAKLMPNLRITAYVTGFTDIYELLKNGKCDLALTWDLGLQADITRETLACVPPHAVLYPDHPLAAHPTTTLAALAEHPLILTDQGLSLAHMRALFTQRGLQPKIQHRTASLDLMRSFAANGLGIGMSYSNPAARVSHDGKPLTTRLITDAGCEPLVLAHLAQNPLNQTAQKFAELLPLALPIGLHAGSTKILKPL
jgi:DNA-binding transcriptional LysR family regulator